MNYNKIWNVNKPLKACTVAVFTILCSLTSCEESYTPKPKSYPRVVIPAKNYIWVDTLPCPFRFKYPDYSKIIKEAKFFDQVAENPCWLNIEYAAFNQRIHLSYKEISPDQTLEKLEADAHKMTDKHISKAESIDGTRFVNKYGVEGIRFDVGGNAASATQFYMTDRKKHFIRGALYFYSEAKSDSLQPMIRSASQDLDTLINSFQWR